MRALTVWQPWATLIAAGAKRHEFRRWKGLPRLAGQRIAIHAGIRPVRPGELAGILQRISDGDSFLADPATEILQGAHPGQYPYGAIVATATLEPSIPPAEVARLAGREGGNDSDRAGHFNWAWPLGGVRAVSPVVEARGAQGFWVLPAAIERQVRSNQLPEAPA